MNQLLSREEQHAMWKAARVRIERQPKAIRAMLERVSAQGNPDIQGLIVQPLAPVAASIDPPVFIPRTAPSVELIKAVCARFYGVTIDDIMSDRRDVLVMRPRQVAMYLSKELTPRSYPDIGRRFNRDHTCVILAVRKIANLVAADFEKSGIAFAVETMRESILVRFERGPSDAS